MYDCWQPERSADHPGRRRRTGLPRSAADALRRRGLDRARGRDDGRGVPDLPPDGARRARPRPLDARTDGDRGRAHPRARRLRLSDRPLLGVPDSRAEGRLPRARLARGRQDQLGRARAHMPGARRGPAGGRTFPFLAPTAVGPSSRSRAAARLSLATRLPPLVEADVLESDVAENSVHDVVRDHARPAQLQHGVALGVE
jgi:hypothetical protein